VAVHAFLRGELSFTGIARVIESTLGELPARPVRHFSDLYAADGEAREVARAVAAVREGPGSARTGAMPS
jgi:1-deoxy-D-xylulose-5-phosphate reductoisomerase